MRPIDKVRLELRRYEHPLITSTRGNDDGSIELVIDLKNPVPGVHLYKAPLHPRDIESGQFTWTFQRLLYDCLHDYLVELFLDATKPRGQAMTPVGEMLRDEIRRGGPVLFRRFMDVALYHAQHGYYRRATLSESTATITPPNRSSRRSDS